ncbi:hypothetical protein IS669_003737 [Escherichia coli]|nr:hypothetical protein [Escherichia coli]
MAVPVCTLASGWYRSFYKTEKGITGRRAHNPIHPGGCHRWCSSLTPMYVNRGGRLTILQEDQGQLLTLAGEPDGKLRAAGR